MALARLFHRVQQIPALDVMAVAGELIELTTHIAAMADVGATVRAKLEAWASTLPPQLAGRDEAAVRATLADQVELLLRALADRMQRHANEGADSV